MPGSKRLISLAVLVALSGALAGCGGGGISNFDPADLLDWMDTKKKLPGERKQVFPEGVPGLEQGVPRDLYKGARQEQIDQQNAAAAAQPLEPPPGSKAAKSKGKSSKQAAAPAAPADPDAAPAEEENSVAAAPPPPKPKIVRRRTTAPPPDPQSQQQPQSAQQQQSAFPAPVPSGSFSR